MNRHIFYSGILLIINVFVFGQNEPDSRDVLVGSLSGEGRFYNVQFQAEVGSVAFQLEVAPDYSVAGKVGNALFKNSTLEIDNWNKGFSVQCKVQGSIFPDKNFHKKCLILLLNVPVGDQAAGDFHMKSNCTFDLWMQPGDFIKFPDEDL